MADLRTLRPSALSGTVNNYAPAGFGVEISRVLQDCSVDSTITGLLALVDGTYVILQNASSSKTLTLTNDDAASSAANRILNPGGASLVLAPGGAVLLDYDTTAVRWRVIATGVSSGGGGGGGAALSRLALAAAGSGALGADMTWVVLTGDSTFQNSLTTICTLTGCGVGTWRVRIAIRYQSSALTTGIGFCCDHTGTVAWYLSNWMMITTGGAAATGVGDQVASVNAGQMAEGKSERAKNTISSASAGVDTVDADMLAVMDVLFEVTATGSIVFKAQAETANNVKVKVGTVLEIYKIG